MDKYIKFLLEKEKKIKEENINYFNTLNNKLRELLKQVGGRYEEIKRIIVFGSFIDGSFNTNSDIDLYIEGLSALNYFAVKRFIEESLGIGIDLYNDGDNKDFVKRIESRGVVFYERKTQHTNCKY